MNTFASKPFWLLTVLAGLIAARMAQGLEAFEAACSAIAQHGQIANDWPEAQALTASRLARQLF